MLKTKILVSVCLCSVFLLAGCVGTPQAPVAPSQSFWQQPDKHIGLLVSKVPAPNVYLPGASCLLCIAAAEMANSSLSEHTETLSVKEAKTLGTDVQNLLQSRGMEVILVDQEIAIDDLPSHDSEVVNSTERDYSVFASQYDITHLLVVNVNALGMQRTYANYIPTADPKGYFNALGYLVDLSDNTYEWYRPVNITKATTGEWDESPNFPGLTNAYYQAIAEGKSLMISSLDERQSQQEKTPPSSPQKATPGNSQ